MSQSIGSENKNSEMTESQWRQEMRHAMWREQDAMASYRKSIAYRERMRITGELKGWEE